MQRNDRPAATSPDIWRFTATFAQLVQKQDLDAIRQFFGGLRIDQKNKFFTFYTTDPVYLISGEQVQNVSISADPRQKRISGEFEVTNRCISPEEIKQHYPGWRVVSIPRGHSLEEKTLFEVAASEMIFTFGFSEKARDCLSLISVSPVREK